jgi:hypothetical protein
MSKKIVCCSFCENLMHTNSNLYCSIDGKVVTTDLTMDRKEQCSGDFKRIGKVRL